MTFTTITKSFIDSTKYQDIIKTQYKTRHENWRDIGAWRWKGIMENYKLVAKYVYDEDKVGIDFGGSDGPIGGCTKIIDIKEHNSLDDVSDNSLDYIFSSHTLEHIKDIIYELEIMYCKLKKDGKIIFHVPSYKKRVWRAGTSPRHHHTFKLSETDDFEAVEIDEVLKAIGFDLTIAEYCGDWGIFIFGEK